MKFEVHPSRCPLAIADIRQYRKVQSSAYPVQSKGWRTLLLTPAGMNTVPSRNAVATIGSGT